ncbi:DUF2510 domain-containing protein [Streptomyces sp. NPDC058001]|uniref:DUF2510 domain-containing protein n=1 Tax=Streptomyces sp. NPDC058001 TaxID=3346300 RepID=UPI0036EE7F43
MTPPPGWYPDPSAPSVQRWWDGTGWTEHRQPPAEAPIPAPVPVPVPGGDGSGRRARLVALTLAGVVLVASIVTGVVVLGGGDGTTDPKARDSTSGEPSSSGASPHENTPSPSATSEPAADDPAVVVDELNGITLPLLDGWVRPKFTTDDSMVMSTDGTYDCPGDSGVCRHGAVMSRTVTANDEKSPRVLALKDIEDAADDWYDRDSIDRRPFNGITSHQRVKAGQVAVAGRTGYYVRWRVKTELGPGGYVQSLAFPSSVGTESMVIVRYVFDAGSDGPPLADMDRITKGIRSVNDADTGGGVGQSMEPLPTP